VRPPGCERRVYSRCRQPCCAWPPPVEQTDPAARRVAWVLWAAAAAALAIVAIAWLLWLS
jgi:hypothetical protein